MKDNMSNDNKENIEVNEETKGGKNTNKDRRKKKRKGFILGGSVGIALTLAVATGGFAMNKDNSKKIDDNKPVVRISDESHEDSDKNGSIIDIANNKDNEEQNTNENNKVKVEEKKAVEEKIQDKKVEESVKKEELKVEEVNEKYISKKSQNVYKDYDKDSETIGKIGEGESILLIKNVGDYSYIQYDTANGSKEGYVPKESLKRAGELTSDFNNFLSIPSNVKKVVYGSSGMGRNLYYYKIGNGKKTLLMNFGIHGYEDAWAKDGYELTKLAKGLIDKLGKNYNNLDLNDWSIYIIPSANPDGLLDGYTNNGPGRCQVTKKIDLNRNFPVKFEPNSNERNFNGTKALAVPESRALANLVSQLSKRGGDFVLLDVHGWLNETLGDYNVSKYFDNQFGIGNTPLNDNFKGYLIEYGKSLGADVSLVELPRPSSKADIKNRNYEGKLYNGVINLLKNYKG